jgi:RNA polymerase sigma factor (sigma-70 family)
MSAAPDRAEELFHEHSRRIYAYCLRQLGSPEEAEDAVQATYLNACRSLLSGFEPEVAQAWLFKVAHNVCLTRQRSTWRRRRIERPGDIHEIEELIASPRTHGDELLGIDDALAALPEQQRRAILLREWQGLSYREVAAEMGITQGAVETLIFRARRGLVAALEMPAVRRKRKRFAHAFDGSALLASLKSSLTGSLSGSLAASLAVAASATAIATGPGIGNDFIKRPFVASARPGETSHSRPRPADRRAAADRDPISIARESSGGGKAEAKDKAHGKAHRRGHPAARGKANANAHRADAGSKAAKVGPSGLPMGSHAGGNGKSSADADESNAGGNGKAKGH